MANLSKSMWNLSLEPRKQISNTIMAMATKPGRVVTNFEGLPLKFSWPFDTVVVWNHVIN